MRILSLNVNGLRSIKEYYRVSKGWSFDQFLDSFEAGILCFQESKINDVTKLEREYALPSEYSGFFTFQRAMKKIAYSGVVTFCRRNSWEPLAYEEGFTGVFSDDESSLIAPNELMALKYETDILRSLDCEGRCIITDHSHFLLIHVYFPNDSGPERTDFREKFYDAIWCRCLDFLQSGRSIILLGDINVCYHPNDHCDYAKPFQDLCNRIGHENVEEMIKQHHQSGLDDSVSSEDRFLIETFYKERPLRSWLYRLLFLDPEAQAYGLRDVFRQFHPNESQKYTCWNTQMSARGTNHGTRIDLIFVAGPLFTGEIIKDCQILPNVMGSDHCPVFIELDLEPVQIEAPVVPKNLKAHHSQKRLSDFFQKKTKGSEDVPEKRSKTSVSKPATKITDFFPVHPRSQDQGVEELDPETIGLLIEDNERASHNWKEIFQRPPAPLCSGHSEPCELRTVNKPGPNKGRKFYLCPRGVGDRNDPMAKCNYFAWFSSNKKNQS